MRRWTKHLFSWITGVIFVASSTAQTTTEADSSAKIFPYAYAMKDLPNGLRVIAIPTGFPNIVALQIPVSVGSRNEVDPASPASRTSSNT
jgi:zinc protease